jgi:hypothetical protein
LLQQIENERRKTEAEKKGRQDIKILKLLYSLHGKAIANRDCNL